MSKAAATCLIALSFGLGACAHNTTVPLPESQAASAPPPATVAAKPATPAMDDAIIGTWGLKSASNPGSMTSEIYLSIRHPRSNEQRLVRLSGFGGANYYVANADFDPKQQRLVLTTPLQATQTWGTQDSMQAEQTYLGMLDRVVSYQVASSELTLTTLKGDKLIFSREGD